MPPVIRTHGRLLVACLAVLALPASAARADSNGAMSDYQRAMLDCGHLGSSCLDMPAPPRHHRAVARRARHHRAHHRQGSVTG